MGKYVLAAFLFDKAEAFAFVEPLNGSSSFFLTWKLSCNHKLRIVCQHGKTA